MLVDDSIVARSVIQGILAPHARFRLVTAVATAEQALRALDTSAVDVVLLDLAMPGIDGLTALPEIIQRSGGARVLVVSASAGEGADACVRALTLGAADTLEKPGSGFADAFAETLVEKIDRLGIAAPVQAGQLAPAPSVRRASVSLAAAVDGPIACLAIGASTGGLHALAGFFAALPPAFDAPILVTQHLPATFMPFFAAQLERMTGRPATVAAEGDPLRRGRILVAPGDAHLTVAHSSAGVRVRLDTAPAPTGCRPSVDPMIASAAAAFGRSAFAVVLSGMGRDGMLGARALADAGGEIAAQDQATSVVWGMPGSVAGAGLAATVGPPAALAARVAARAIPRTHAG